MLVNTYTTFHHIGVPQNSGTHKHFCMFIRFSHLKKKSNQTKKIWREQNPQKQKKVGCLSWAVSSWLWGNKTTSVQGMQRDLGLTSFRRRKGIEGREGNLQEVRGARGLSLSKIGSQKLPPKEKTTTPKIVSFI